MKQPSDNRLPDAEVVEFLGAHHDAEPTRFELLGGGFWSVAYGYRIGDEDLVLRINDGPDGFRADEVAMGYGSPALPVPEVRERFAAGATDVLLSPSPQAFSDYIQAESARWGKVVREAGIRLE